MYIYIYRYKRLATIQRFSVYKLHSSSFEIFEKKNFRIISSYVFNDKPRDGGSNNVTSGPFPCQLPFGSLYSCNVVELSSISIPSLVPDVTGVTYFIHCGEKVHDSRTLLNLGGRRGREKKKKALESVGSEIPRTL